MKSEKPPSKARRIVINMGFILAASIVGIGLKECAKHNIEQNKIYQNNIIKSNILNFDLEINKNDDAVSAPYLKLSYDRNNFIKYTPHFHENNVEMLYYGNKNIDEVGLSKYFSKQTLDSLYNKHTRP